MGLQLDDEEEDQAAPAADDQGDLAPTANAPVTPAAPDMNKDAVMKDYLRQQYGEATDDSAVKEARDRAGMSDLFSQLGQAGETIARRYGTALGGPGADSKFWGGIRQSAHDDVASAQADRQAKIRDFVTQNQLQRQGVEDTRKAAEFEHKQGEWDAKDATRDPNSRESQMARHLWGSANPDVASADGFDQMSAADLAAAKDPIDLKAKLDANKELRRASNMAHADATQARAAAKDAAGKGTNYIKMNGEVNGAGRAPPDIRQSLMDRVSINKANELLDRPDLNSITGSEAKLVAGELEKIATGGSGTEAGRQGLNPHTFEQSWADFKNKFAGADDDVVAANIGPFLQKQKAYLQGLKKITDKRLNSYQRGVHDTYLDAGMITDEQSEKFQKRHPDLFPELQDGGGEPATAGASEGGKTAQTTPGKKMSVPKHPVGSVITTKAGKQFRVKNDAGDLEEIDPSVAAK